MPGSSQRLDPLRLLLVDPAREVGELARRARGARAACRSSRRRSGASARAAAGGVGHRGRVRVDGGRLDAHRELGAVAVDDQAARRGQPVGRLRLRLAAAGAAAVDHREVRRARREPDEAEREHAARPARMRSDVRRRSSDLTAAPPVAPALRRRRARARQLDAQHALRPHEAALRRQPPEPRGIAQLAHAHRRLARALEELLFLARDLGEARSGAAGSRRAA